MSLTRSLATISGIGAVLFFCTTALAGVEQGSPTDSLNTDDGLGLDTSALVQDVDVQPSSDVKQLSELLQRRVETAQAMHAGDEEVSEPVGDDF